MTNLYWLPILVAIAFLLARVAGGHPLKFGITPRQAMFALTGLILMALAGIAAYALVR
jgi:hypothetical protein